MSLSVRGALYRNGRSLIMYRRPDNRVATIPLRSRVWILNELFPPIPSSNIVVLIKDVLFRFGRNFPNENYPNNLNLDSNDDNIPFSILGNFKVRFEFVNTPQSHSNHLCDSRISSCVKAEETENRQNATQNELTTRARTCTKPMICFGSEEDSTGYRISPTFLTFKLSEHGFYVHITLHTS